MAIDAQQIQEAAEERISAAKVLSTFGGNREFYSSWKQRISDVDLVNADQWTVLWPDARATNAKPLVPNLVKMAGEDRMRLVASGNPTIVKRPGKPGDRAKKASEKLERILHGYWGRSRVGALIPALAGDAMVSGLCAMKVMPDMETFIREGKRSMLFPRYQRLDPRSLYPSPVFTPGPWLDDAIISIEDKARTIASRYPDADVMGLTKAQFADSSMVRVIEFYDKDSTAIIATSKAARGQDRQPGGYTWLVPPTAHNLDHCPVVIGTRPTMDGVYRGDFDSILSVLNTWNRLMTLHLDAATGRVYPATLDFEIENPGDWGPDAMLHKETAQGSFEFITPPGAAYENHQLMAQMYEFARAGAILPAARSGAPTQSIISAAGVSAVTGQESDHVRSLQRDTIGPMLEAANELALNVDERWGDVDKDISGYARGQSFTESYKPSKDIAGDYTNQVVYGIYGGLDEINQNVMLLQNGGKVISWRQVREQSPLVEDPIETERQIALEKLDEAILTGIFVGASQPPGSPGAIDPFTVTKIRKALSDGSKSLDEAVAELAPQAPVVSPAPEPGLPGAPGIPGAARGQQPQQPQAFNGPPLGQLLAGARPGG